MKKLSVIGFTIVSAALGLSVVVFLAAVKAIEEAHDHDYFWE
jgi:hypothetical protein